MDQPEMTSGAAGAGTRRHRATAMDGAIALIAILLIVQMWLLTAALENLLAGHAAGALPAAIVSALLFGGNLALYLFIERIDRKR